MRFSIMLEQFSGAAFSSQGRELHYEVQTVVPYIITMELLPVLKKGSQGMVIQTSSDAFRFRKTFVPEELEKPKLALTLWTHALAPELKKEGITLISVDPGNNNTMRKGRNGGLPLFIQPFIRLFGPHSSVGASRLFAGLERSTEDAGLYISKGKPTEYKIKQHASQVLFQVRIVHEKEFISCKRIQLRPLFVRVLIRCSFDSADEEPAQ